MSGIDAIFTLKLPFETALERVCGQYMHTDNQSYHLVYDPPKAQKVFYMEGLS